MVPDSLRSRSDRSRLKSSIRVNHGLISQNFEPKNHSLQALDKLCHASRECGTPVETVLCCCMHFNLAGDFYSCYQDFKSPYSCVMIHLILVKIRSWRGPFRMGNHRVHREGKSLSGRLQIGLMARMAQDAKKVRGLCGNGVASPPYTNSGYAINGPSVLSSCPSISQLTTICIQNPP